MRSQPFARKLLVRLPIAAAAALVIWFAAGAELCGRSLTAVAEPLIRAFERPSATVLQWDAAEIAIRRSDLPDKTASLGFRPAALTGNTVLLLALLFATPGALSGRGPLRAFAALAALFAGHVVHFVLAVETLYATQLGEWSVRNYPRWQREVVATGRYLFDIALTYAIPILLWAFLVLLPLLRERDAGVAGPKKTARR